MRMNSQQSDLCFSRGDVAVGGYKPSLSCMAVEVGTGSWGTSEAELCLVLLWSCCLCLVPSVAAALILFPSCFLPADSPADPVPPALPPSRFPCRGKCCSEHSRSFPAGVGHSGGADMAQGNEPCAHNCPNNCSFLPTETTIKQLDPHDMDELERLAAE